MLVDGCADLLLNLDKIRVDNEDVRRRMMGDMEADIMNQIQVDLEDVHPGDSRI
jgi:hypothetical protein